MDVNKDVIYFANYCTEDDFEHLKELGYDVRGKIVICRYGRIFRGNKVNL